MRARQAFSSRGSPASGPAGGAAPPPTPPPACPDPASVSGSAACGAAPMVSPPLSRRSSFVYTFERASGAMPARRARSCRASSTSDCAGAAQGARARTSASYPPPLESHISWSLSSAANECRTRAVRSFRERRHRLLRIGRRQRHRRHGTRQGTGAARPRGPAHQQRAAGAAGQLPGGTGVPCRPDARLSVVPRAASTC